MTHPLITQEYIDTFQRDGVVLIKGLFKDHVETIRKGIEKNMAEPGEYAAENLKAGEGGRFFDDYCNWTPDPRIRGGDPHLARRRGRRRPDAVEHGAAVPRPRAGQRTGHLETDPLASGWPLLLRRGRADRQLLVADGPGAGGIPALRRGFAQVGEARAADPMAVGGELLSRPGRVHCRSPTPMPKAWTSGNGRWRRAMPWRSATASCTVPAATDAPARRRAFSLRLVGDDARYVERPGRTSPPFPGHGMTPGQKLREDWFPTIYRR